MQSASFQLKVDIKLEGKAFINYTLAKTGYCGLKLDFNGLFMRT